MLKCIKKAREYKIKNRLYLEAKYLNDANFTIGQSIEYKLNKDRKSITLTVIDDSFKDTAKGTTKKIVKKVAKTRNRIGETPVIDIKTKEVKEFLNSHDNIVVSVFKGKIIFKVKEAAKATTIRKVIHLKDSYKYYGISMKKFSKVVNCDQISLFELFNLDDVELTDSNSFKSSLQKKSIKMISLFSGAGLLDKGFLDNGNYDIQFACDMSTPIEYDLNGKKKRPANDLGKYHLETYRTNIGNHIIDKDILTLSKEDIPNNADIVVGGVPCTKFSKLNTSNSSFRKVSSTDFPLLDKFIDVIRWSNAKCFLIENVVDFVKTKGGILLQKLKSLLSDFQIESKIINSKDLGSAQNRTRVFIVGMKNIKPNIQLPIIHETRTVKQAFENIEGAPQQDVYGETKHTSKAWKRMLHVPPGGNLSNVPEHLRPPKKKFNDYCMRLDFNTHSPTITHIGDAVIFHPIENRKLSIREAARLFSLPDDFIFKGSITSMYEQIKNGVDYKVSSFLAKAIAERLLPII